MNGRSKATVTNDVRQFQPPAGQVGIEVVTPGIFLEKTLRKRKYPLSGRL